MNEWIEGSDKVRTVSVWTPWGEQKVQRSDGRAAARRANERMTRDEAPGGADAVSPVG